MTPTQQVRQLIADTEKHITAITGEHAKLRLQLTVDETLQHELVLQACAIWQVDVAAIKVRDRHKHVVTMRQLLAWLLKQKTLLTLRQIAVQLGYAGHDDVIHAVKKIQQYIACNDAIATTYYEPIKHLFYND